MFKNNPLIVLLSLSVALIPHSTLAGDILQVFRGSPNGTVNQIQPITVPLAPGNGVTLSFLPSNQTIAKVWLDNPSFAVIDSNGCLSGLPSVGNCTGEGAKVLHLRRINDLTIPGLPKTSSTLLTVITESPSGGGIYLFKLIKSPKPGKLVYEVIDPNSTPSILETHVPR